MTERRTSPRRLAGVCIAMSVAVTACGGGGAAITGTGGSTLAPTRPAGPAATPAASAPAASVAPPASAGSVIAVVPRPAAAGGGYLVLGRDGRVAATLPDGLFDATGGFLWSAVRAGADTELRSVHVPTGSVSEPLRLPGAWRIPELGETGVPIGLAGDGNTLLLVDAGAGETARAQTRLAVIDTKSVWVRTDALPPATHDLPGWFEVDTLAPDGRVAYLTELRPTATTPEGYVVRALELPAATLREGLIADKRTQATGMAGEAYAQLPLAGGLVFTLYVGPATFIHALHTADGGAVCIALPDPTGGSATDWSTGSGDGDERADHWAMTALPGGGVVAAVNPSLGIAHRIALEGLQVLSTTTFEPQAIAGDTASAVAVGSSFIALATADGVIELDLTDGRIASRRLAGHDIRIVAAIADGRVVAVDADGGPHLLGG